jgi:hypothetical protein
MVLEVLDRALVLFCRRPELNVPRLRRFPVDGFSFRE